MITLVSVSVCDIVMMCWLWLWAWRRGGVVRPRSTHSALRADSKKSTTDRHTRTQAPGNKARARTQVHGRAGTDLAPANQAA
eukprot:scaffold7047_cov136-Isochrysis_galbana.AAC.1